MENFWGTTSGVLITEVLLQTPPLTKSRISSDEELNFCEIAAVKQPTQQKTPQFRKTCLQVQVPSNQDTLHESCCSLPINSPTARERRAFSHQAAINASGMNSPTREEKQQYPWLFETAYDPESGTAEDDHSTASPGKRKLIMSMNTFRSKERQAIYDRVQGQHDPVDNENDQEEITIRISSSSIDEHSDTHVPRKRLMAISDMSKDERRIVSGSWIPQHIGGQYSDHSCSSMNILQSF